MILTIFETVFGTIKVDIEPSSLKFEGSIEGYDYKDLKSKNCIGFSLIDPSKTEEIVTAIKLKFNRNPEYVDINAYIGINRGYEIPKIWIILDNGSRGMSNPFSFNLSN